MGKRYGRSAKKKTKRPAKALSRKKTRQPSRLPLLGRIGKTITRKRVGSKGQFLYDADELRTEIKFSEWRTPETKERLLNRAKNFRKRVKARKTRVIVEFEASRSIRGKRKKFTMRTSTMRSEPDSQVDNRIEYAMEKVLRDLRGYARVGYKIGKIKKVILERLTHAPRKKKQTKNAIRRIRYRGK